MVRVDRDDMEDMDDRADQQKLRQFVREWGLDDMSYLKLKGLSTNKLDIVLNEFRPPARTRNVDSKLAAFVRSVSDKIDREAARSRRGRGGLPSPILDESWGSSTRTEALESQIHDFLTLWSLDEASAQLLWTRKEDAAREIIRKFKPSCATQQANTDFQDFVQQGDFAGRDHSVESSRPAEAEEDIDSELEAFIERWKLNKEAQDLLLRQPREALLNIMALFEPPSDEKTSQPDHSLALMDFVKRIPQLKAPRGPSTTSRVNSTKSSSPAKGLKTPSSSSLTRARTRPRASQREGTETEKSASASASASLVVAEATATSAGKQSSSSRTTTTTTMTSSTSTTAEMKTNGSVTTAKQVQTSTSESSTVTPLPSSPTISEEPAEQAPATVKGMTTTTTTTATATTSTTASEAVSLGKTTTFTSTTTASVERRKRSNEAGRRCQASDEDENEVEAGGGADGLEETVDLVEDDDDKEEDADDDEGDEDPLQLASADFRSKAAVRKPNGKPKGKPKTKAKAKGRCDDDDHDSREKFEVFARRWKLKDESMEALLSLPEEEAEAIMLDYMPPLGTADVDINFKSYLRKRQGVVDTTVTSGLEEFCSRWRVEFDVKMELEQLPKDILQGVMRDFKPPAGTFDLSASVRDFAQRRRFQRPDPPEVEYSSQSHIYRNYQKRNTPKGEISSDIRKFTERWGLDEQCAVTLSRSTTEIQWHAIHNFAPRGRASNPSSKFMAWLRLQQQQQGPLLHHRQSQQHHHQHHHQHRHQQQQQQQQHQHHRKSDRSPSVLNHKRKRKRSHHR